MDSSTKDTLRSLEKKVVEKSLKTLAHMVKHEEHKSHKDACEHIAEMVKLAHQVRSLLAPACEKL